MQYYVREFIWIYTKHVEQNTHAHVHSRISNTGTYARYNTSNAHDILLKTHIQLQNT